VYPQAWAYGAGGNEDAGRVMEPRKMESGGRQDHPQGVAREKPTVCSEPEGSSPGCDTARRQDTTGI
jgi:hypothetical protein